MRGHIRKRGSKYEILIYENLVDGSRKYRPFSGYNSRREAEEALPDILKAAQENTMVAYNSMKMKEYLDVWLKEHVARNVTGGTEDKYKAASKIAKKAIGEVNLQKVGPAEIQRFVNEASEDRAPSTVNSYYNAIKAAFTVARKWQLVSINPCHDVILPTQKKQVMKTYTKEQVQALLEEAEGTIFYLPILLYVSCGLRRGEALGLKWRDVDLTQRVMQIQESYTTSSRGAHQGTPKTSGSHRSVDFSQAAKEALEEQKAKQEKILELPNDKITDLQERKKALREQRKTMMDTYVCTWPDNAPIEPGYAGKQIKILMDKAGLEVIRVHDLRHTHATLLLQAGVHPKVVQERLGHSDISITLNTYSHVTRSMQRQAADILNF